MVSLDIVQSSNAQLPSRLIAVFVGGTSGIGEYTLKAFARHCQHPHAYFIGRSQSAADRILSELKTLNPKGEYTFIKSDISLIKNVDKTCEEISAKERYVNILFNTSGTMITGVETDEGLHLPASLVIHSRTRFALNLLPLLQAAPDLRRVVSCSFGTKEGPIVNEDLQVRNISGSPLKLRGQAAATITLSLEEVAKRAPDISFIHDFPGPVRSNIARDGGWRNFMLRTVFKVIGPLVYIPDNESGDRHLYLATSAKYPAKTGNVDGVKRDGVEVARGTDGEKGSGVYVVDEKCEEGNARVVQVLEALRKEGRNEFVWQHIQGEFKRITGKESMNS